MGAVDFMMCRAGCPAINRGAPMHNRIMFRIDGCDGALDGNSMTGDGLRCDPIHIEAAPPVAIIDKGIFRTANQRAPECDDAAHMFGVVSRGLAGEIATKTPADEGDGAAQRFASAFDDPAKLIAEGRDRSLASVGTVSLADGPSRREVRGVAPPAPASQITPEAPALGVISSFSKEATQRAHRAVRCPKSRDDNHGRAVFYAGYRRRYKFRKAPNFPRPERDPKQFPPLGTA